MQKKATLKKYITIGVDTRIMQQKEAQKYDTQLAIQSIKQLKNLQTTIYPKKQSIRHKNNKKCINKEIGAFDQIPLKTREKTGQLQTKQYNNPLTYRHKK